MSLALLDEPPPNWGERLLLARRRRGINLAEAAHRMSQVMPVSYGTITRLEQMTEPPVNRKQRAYAALLLLVYGVNPENFGLRLEELPAVLTTKEVRDLMAVVPDVPGDVPKEGSAWIDRSRADLAWSAAPALLAG